MPGRYTAQLAAGWQDLVAEPQQQPGTLLPLELVQPSCLLRVLRACRTCCDNITMPFVYTEEAHSR